ncbi:hypothetical protein NQV05_02155 [Mycoplasmopsis agalactiae]|uniref:hypothetical protein n=1 Tax=Mycoplasmopsis agalactiae TaxID=2110 RepID=UPI00211CFD70|nr:hypothetical protein [Mycoplasmopsis agalactiae]UUM25186.1 hypothetical protein NQV05_02155 [Mycoplasmopsis agalactiae]
MLKKNPLKPYTPRNPFKLFAEAISGKKVKTYSPEWWTPKRTINAALRAVIKNKETKKEN